MKCTVAIPIFFAMIACAVGQDADTTTTVSTTTVSEPTTTSSTTTSSTTAATTTTGSTTAETTTTGSTTPTVNNCTQTGKYPATSQTCSPDFIVCIPNFKGEFWQHKWRCPGAFVYNDKYKKCTPPKLADGCST